jgi:hypothetical protein
MKLHLSSLIFQAEWSLRALQKTKHRLPADHCRLYRPASKLVEKTFATLFATRASPPLSPAVSARGILSKEFQPLLNILLLLSTPQRYCATGACSRRAIPLHARGSMAEFLGPNFRAEFRQDSCREGPAETSAFRLRIQSKRFSPALRAQGFHFGAA